MAIDMSILQKAISVDMLDLSQYLLKVRNGGQWLLWRGPWWIGMVVREKIAQRGVEGIYTVHLQERHVLFLDHHVLVYFKILESEHVHWILTCLSLTVSVFI